MNKTFVMIKPDAVRRQLVGKILSRFEETQDITIKAMKMMILPKDLAAKHYAEHEGKEFYENLIKFVTSGPVVPMLLEGEGIIQKIRDMIGATDPAKADPGTIRGDFKEIPVKTVTENMIHASDSVDSAKREITLFFGADYLK
ncbi:MAG: nucleoside-diphosphate kinase [Promethearchaeota archaeon]|nr:MAG: nucleoside-diphosphate kinase [Candidatus Lokiarchaeota archaeon]